MEAKPKSKSKSEPGGQTPGGARAADAEAASDAEAAPDPDPDAEAAPLPDAEQLVGNAEAWEMMFEDMFKAGVAANTSNPGAVEHFRESLENLAHGEIDPETPCPEFEFRLGATGTGAPAPERRSPAAGVRRPDSKFPPCPRRLRASRRARSGPGGAREAPARGFGGPRPPGEGGGGGAAGAGSSRKGLSGQVHLTPARTCG